MQRAYLDDMIGRNEEARKLGRCDNYLQNLTTLLTRSHTGASAKDTTNQTAGVNQSLLWCVRFLVSPKPIGDELKVAKGLNLLPAKSSVAIQVTSRD